MKVELNAMQLETSGIHLMGVSKNTKFTKSLVLEFFRPYSSYHVQQNIPGKPFAVFAIFTQP